MAIRWDEFLANIERYKRVLRPDERIVLPRLEAKRRAANKEKRHRIVFDADETTYAAFHTQLKRYRELVENVTIAQQIICEILERVPDETIRAIAEERADSEHIFGRTQSEAE